MKRYIAVLELEADEKVIEADVRYNYSIDGEDFSVLDCVQFEEENKQENKQENKKTYEDGLNDAWKVARKIGGIDDGYTCGELSDIFGSCSAGYIFDYLTVSEAMDAIEKHERPKVGDEVEYISTSDKGVVVHIQQYTQQIDVMWENGLVGMRVSIEKLKKTGRHFPQIEEVLKQMNESEE